MSFTAHTIQPTNHPAVARLAFTVEIPADFQQVPLPAEEVDFSQPDKFLPLAIFMAPYGAVLFTAAARPAFGDGCVSQWVDFLCEKQSLTITERSIVDSRFGKALLAAVSQPTGAGELTMRLVFIEDGGSLLQFAVIAPTQIFPSLEQQLMHALASVLLINPSGPTHPLIPAQPAPEESAPTEKAPAEKTPQPETYKDFLIAKNIDALEPTHKTTAYFRDKGIGLVPRIHNFNHAEAHVTLAPASLESFLTIPIGWHIIDDGRRTLIFDSPGGTQINIAPTPESTLDEIFTNIESDLLPQNPAADHRRVELEGTLSLVLRNLQIEGETLDQVYIPLAHPTRPGTFLKLRLTTPPAHLIPMLNLAGLIYKSIRAQP